jgi:hypothetical protein
MKIVFLVVLLVCAFGQSNALFDAVCGVLNLLNVLIPSSYSVWSQCYAPTGDPVPIANAIIADVSAKGCLLPPTEYINTGIAALTAEDITAHPLFSYLPTTACGKCGRRARCCKTLGLSFTTQPWQSESCGSSSVCTVNHISSTTTAQLAALPELASFTFDVNDPCNFHQYLDAYFSLAAADTVSYTFVQPLLTQLLGTSSPSVNCVNEGGQCKCCCAPYTYSNGQCS